MTTKKAEQQYLDEHLSKWKEKDYAVYNPKNLSIESLPIIYGFNNGGTSGFLSAVLISEDGIRMGGHACSSEPYMLHDLGILEGARPDRHEYFKEVYPEGYRMDFVPEKDVLTHKGLLKACEKNQRLNK